MEVRIAKQKIAAVTRRRFAKIEMNRLVHISTPSIPSPGCGIVLSEPPHGPSQEQKMARRRGQQKGHVHQQGKVWYLAYREDALDGNGRLIRSRHDLLIGDAKEVSKREAQRIAGGILK